MIDYIKFKNYKAFKSGEIKLKPITVLLGANSVGKSAILQLLLMLQQTNKAASSNYKSALKLYGGFINLGEVENIFRNKEIDKPVQLSFKIKSNSINDEMKSFHFERFISRFEELGYLLPLKKSKKGFFSKLKIFDEEVEYENSLDSNKLRDFEYFKDYIERLIEGYKNFEPDKSNTKDFIIYRHHFRRSSLVSSFFSPSQLTDEFKEEILTSYQMLQQLSNFSNEKEYQLDYLIESYKDTLYIAKVTLSQEPYKIIELSCTNFTGKDYKLNFESILIDKRKINKKSLLNIKEVFIPNNPLFNVFNVESESERSKYGASILAKSLHMIFNSFQEQLVEDLSPEKINYVSPLRAHPQRYYMLDKAKINLQLDTFDGEALAEILKDNSIIRRKVNKWLESFGLNVQVEVFKEIIHKLKIKQNNNNLDITDVGFGISQVLPVIIQGFLSEPDSLTIIEQPEIHLHPKMQADLADLFIDIVNLEKEKFLLIETHSEYFLKRLRRRIAEGKISNDDVKIYLIHQDSIENYSYIEDLNIEKGGAFKYPKDYYGGELLKDSTEFMKIQLKQ